MSNEEEILKSEYSQKFDEIRKASMVQSFFKYGPARKNYVNGNCNALASMENCVKKCTSSDDSVGLVGLCATEMEQLRKDSFYD